MRRLVKRFIALFLLIRGDLPHASTCFRVEGTQKLKLLKASLGVALLTRCERKPLPLGMG